MPKTNTEFNLRGLNHLALVCRDMERTVEFYSGILGMPLIKTIDLPNGMGQHFFFDIGNGDALAFFWFPHAPEMEAGYAAPAHLPMKGDIVSAISSMNHVAFNVAPEDLEAYREKLIARGIEVGRILNHDDSEFGISKEFHDGVWVRSIYFTDPDGIVLEFAASTREFTEADVRHTPARAVDRTI